MIFAYMRINDIFSLSNETPPRAPTHCWLGSSLRRSRRPDKRQEAMTIAMKCSNVADFANHADYEQARKLWAELYRRIEDKLNEAYTETCDTSHVSDEALVLFADWFADLLEDFGDEFGAHEIRYQVDEAVANSHF